MDIAKGQRNLFAPLTIATATPASGVEFESRSDSEDGFTGVIDSREASSEDSCNTLNIRDSTTGDERGKARASVSSSSSSTSSSSPSTSRAQLRSSPRTSIKVQHTSSLESQPPISPAPPSEVRVATQLRLHKPSPTSMSQPSPWSPASNSGAANPPVSNLSSLQLSRSAFIGDQVYRLPSAKRFVLVRMNLKFFRNDFLKFNRDKDIQLITDEVLVEAYRIFVIRFFPFAPEKLEVLRRVSASTLPFLHKF